MPLAAAATIRWARTWKPGSKCCPVAGSSEDKTGQKRARRGGVPGSSRDMHNTDSYRIHSVDVHVACSLQVLEPHKAGKGSNIGPALAWHRMDGMAWPEKDKMRHHYPPNKHEACITQASHRMLLARFCKAGAPEGEPSVASRRPWRPISANSAVPRGTAIKDGSALFRKQRSDFPLSPFPTPAIHDPSHRLSQLAEPLFHCDLLTIPDPSTRPCAHVGPGKEGME